MRSRRLRRTKTRGPRKHHGTPEDSQKHNPDRLTLSLPLLSWDAARLWTCVWPLPMQQQPEVTLHKQPLIVKSHIAGIKFLISEVRAFTTVPLSGQQMVDRTQQSPEPCSMQQTAHHAATDSKCRQNPLNTRWKHEIKIALLRRSAAMTGTVLPDPTARAEWLLASLIDRVLSHCVRAPPLDGGDADMRTDTTVQHPMMTVKTSLLSPVNNSHHCSNQTSSLARSPPLGLLAL